MPLPIALYSASQVRALDAHAIQNLGVSGYTLMKRAGEAALRFLRSRWPMSHRIAIVCGAGNNGGDGYVLARFAQAAGLTVTVLAAKPVEALKGEALQAYNDFVASEGRVQPFSPELLSQGEVIVDALFGTGLNKSVQDEDAKVIAAINEASRPVCALDIPSGLNADTGNEMGDAVYADCTVTFVGLKTGLFFGDGPEHTGTVYFDDLEVVPPETPDFAPCLERIVEIEILRALPRRARAAHKGDFGRVLIIGSGVGMPGAVRMSGEACLRVGAGLVTVAVAPENVSPIASGRPELICLGFEDRSTLEQALDKASVVAIGPGLGKTEWSSMALSAALDSGKPLVVDADALNLIAERKDAPRDNWILTPHPGEAARMLGVSTEEVQNERISALEQLVERYGGTIVLKGAGTLVGGKGRTHSLCERGNPGMASPGMGDVLTGAIAGVLAQSRDPWLSTRAAVLIHAMAGDAVARGGERGLLATDVARELRTFVNL